MTEKKSDYDTKPPRPEDIKVTAKKPTIEQLKEYRAAWLKEAEDNGLINDLFLIVKTFGVIPGVRVHRGWEKLRRFEFTDGDSDYVILYDMEYDMAKPIGETVYVVENGEHMREIEYGNKRLVKVFRYIVDVNSIKYPDRTSKLYQENHFVPGYWDGLIGVFATDARYEMTDGKKKKVDNERKNLLKDLNLIQRVTHKK